MDDQRGWQQERSSSALATAVGMNSNARAVRRKQQRRVQSETSMAGRTDVWKKAGLLSCYKGTSRQAEMSVDLSVALPLPVPCCSCECVRGLTNGRNGDEWWRGVSGERRVEGKRGSQRRTSQTSELEEHEGANRSVVLQVELVATRQQLLDQRLHPEAESAV